MRIGIFIDEYFPKVHGVATSTANFKQALERQGHTVYIIAPSEPDYVDIDPHVIRLQSFDPKIFNTQTRFAVFYPGLARKLAKYEFDVVHSQTQFSMGILAHEVAKMLKIPHVSTMHTVFAEFINQYRFAVYSAVSILSVVYPLYFRAAPKMDITLSDLKHPNKMVKEQVWRAGNVYLNHTDGVIAPSQHVGRSLKRYGLTKTCYVLPNGINTDRFTHMADQPLPDGIHKDPKDIWLVSVGRMSGEKRQDALIRAMKNVTDPHVKLVLVGDGPAYEEFQALAQEIGVTNRVLFLGRQSQDAVASIMGHSDIFAITSYRFDNQPMVILEAIAAELPVIYCDSKLKEGLTKENALLTETPKPDSIAQAINTLAGDPTLRKQMSQASLKLSQKFNVDVLATRLVSIYKRVIKQKQRQLAAEEAEVTV